MSDLRFLKTRMICETVSMSLPEILKPNAAPGANMEPRAHILHDRIMSGQPIELVKGGSVIIDKLASKEVLVALASNDEDVITTALGMGRNYVKAFITDDGQELPVSAFSKAPYFGGGAAARQSAQQTGVQESATAVGIARAAVMGRDIAPKDLQTAGALSKVMRSRYKGSDTIDEMMEIFAIPAWAQSICNTANKLRGKFDIGEFKIHRGSPWVKTLEKKFNVLNKDLDGKRTFPNINKWNPSDIWMVKEGVTIPTEINDLAEFNAWLVDQFEKQKVIGVSLKMTPKNTKLKVYNYDEDLDELLGITVKQLLVAKTNKLFRSKGSHIIYECDTELSSLRAILEKENSLDVRQFKAQDNVNAEITGEFAAGGKVSFGPVNKILKKLKLPQMTHRNELSKKIDREVKDKTRFEKFVNEIIDMAAEVEPDKAEAARDILPTILSGANFNGLVGKYQAVELMKILKGTNNAKRRDFIQHSIRYASSQSDLSSVFVKVW